MATVQFANFNAVGVTTLDTSANSSTGVLRDSVGNITGNTVTGTALVTSGRQQLPVTTVAASTTLTTSTAIVSEQGSGGAITLTLPPAAGNTGQVISAKRNAASNNVILDANSAELIDGSATRTLTTQYACVVIYCNGTGWEIRSQMGTIT